MPRKPDVAVPGFRSAFNCRCSWPTLYHEEASIISGRPSAACDHPNPALSVPGG